jgi:hypothetical protein
MIRTGFAEDPDGREALCPCFVMIVGASSSVDWGGGELSDWRMSEPTVIRWDDPAFAKMSDRGSDAADFGSIGVPAAGSCVVE